MSSRPSRLTRAPQRESAFTLIELLVVMAIISILASMLFPVFAKARGKAEQTVCISNSKQLAMAFLMYAQDYDGHLPMHDPETTTCDFQHVSRGVNDWTTSGRMNWAMAIQSQIKNYQIYACPSTLGPGSGADESIPPISYLMNGNLIGMLQDVDQSSNAALLWDWTFDASAASVDPYQGAACIHVGWAPHDGFHTVAFLDGHSKAVPESRVIADITTSGPDNMFNWQ